MAGGPRDRSRCPCELPGWDGCQRIHLGERAIGKTFLLRMVAAALRVEGSTLPIPVSAVAHFGPDAQELRHVAVGTVLASVQTIWKEVLGHRYSELRASLAEPKQLGIGSAARLETLTKRIYREVMAPEQRLRFSQERSAGVAMFAKGEIAETREVEVTAPFVYPFEFVEFVEELIEALKERGIDRLTILLDEANKLTLSGQQQLLSEYIDLFSSHSVNFAFVAGVNAAQLEEPRVPTAFGRVEQITALDPSSASALADKAISCLGLMVEDGAIDVILAFAEGRPFRILTLVGDVAETMSPNGVAVTREEASRVVNTFAEMLEQQQKHVWPPAKP